MRNTRRLWQSLEATPFVRGVRAQWVDYVGEDLPLLHPYLKPDGRYAESYPCPRPGGELQEVSWWMLLSTRNSPATSATPTSALLRRANFPI